MRHQKKRGRVNPTWVVLAGAVIIVLVAIIVAVGRHDKSAAADAPPPPGTLPHKPGTYLGVYAARVPVSYAGVTAFTTATGVTPDVVMYYSAWYEPFHVGFATAAASHGAVPLIQMEPKGINLANITAGKYDGYLSQYAAAVRSYHHPVILSFGHEMNGSWYSWGHGHASPKAFVAAWRHIVRLFRTLGATNVTWMWTVNIMDLRNNKIPAPAPWWPGSKYVNWVGIDGYYNKPSYAFAPLFGPTITRVKELTRDPILIAETGAPAADQPAKIADLFAGIRNYGLLGFVWFDTADTGIGNYRIKSAEAAATFRQGAKTYKFPAP